MEKYIYINYAYEDQQQVMTIIRQIEAAGVKVYYGNGSEERVAGSVCVIHFCTAASHTSKSYRKIMNYTLRHEMDSMLFHLENQTVTSEVEMQLDVLHTLFKYKYKQESAGYDITEDKQDVEQAPSVMTETVQAKEAVETVDSENAETIAANEAVNEAADPMAANEAADSGAEKTAAAEEIPESEKAPTKDELFLAGRRWMTGDGCDVDVDKAFSCFRQAASQGHVEAQYQLSVCYDKGIGVRRSISEAAKWCQMAAYGGHAQAQSEIGYCYEYGQGVVRNIKEAVRWYEIASDQGNIEAKNNLAFCYQKGKGVIKNVQKAIRLYQEAADAGHASAQYNLGFCYWYGEGIRADKPKAIELFKQSAANGNAKAGQMLKILNQHAYVR